MLHKPVYRYRVESLTTFSMLRGEHTGHLFLLLGACRTQEQSPGHFLDKKGPRKFHKYYFLLALTPHD